MTSPTQMKLDRRTFVSLCGASALLPTRSFGQGTLPTNPDVVIVGAGGLGAPLIQYLAAAGVGTIGIVDHDKVEDSNLQRQVLFTTNDIGRFKAEVAKERVLAQNFRGSMPLQFCFRHRYK